MMRAAIWGEEFKREEGVTTEELFNEASRYEIASLLSTKLDVICNDDPAVRKIWSKVAMIDYMKNTSALTIQTLLADALAPAGIKPVILKGMAAAYYFPDPLLRHMGDIDFMILPEHYDEGCRVLEENGYLRTHDDGRHTAFYYKKIDYECHRYFSWNRTAAEKELDRIIFEGCRNCVTRTIDGKSFYALPDEIYGLVILEHIRHHMYTGVGFRQIYDWVFYVDKVLDDDMWNRSFRSMAEACGLDRFAKVLTKLSKLYLGLRTDNTGWCDDVNEDVCEEVIEMILDCNNFGFADRRKAVISSRNEIKNKGYLKMLNQRAIKHIPAAEKIIILRPVAWMYQIIRWAVQWVRYVALAPKDSEGARQYRELYRKIGI